MTDTHTNTYSTYSKVGAGVCIGVTIILLKSSVIGIFIAAGVGSAATAYYINKTPNTKRVKG